MQEEQTEPSSARTPWTEPVVQKLESSRAAAGLPVAGDLSDSQDNLS